MIPFQLSLRVAIHALVTAALAEAALGGATLGKADAAVVSPVAVAAASSREAATIDLDRPQYAVRKLQVVGIRCDERGDPLLRFDVRFDDHAVLDLREIADAIGSIVIGKGDAGMPTKLLTIDGAAKRPELESLEKAPELEIPLGREVLTVFDPDRDYTLVVSHIVNGPAADRDATDSRTLSLRIANRFEEARCFYLLPGAGATICFAGSNGFAGTEPIELAVIDAADAANVESLGAATLGKGQLHGLPQFTGVAAGMRPGAVLTLVVAIAS